MAEDKTCGSCKWWFFRHESATVRGIMGVCKGVPQGPRKSKDDFCRIWEFREPEPGPNQRACFNCHWQSDFRPYSQPSYMCNEPDRPKMQPASLLCPKWKWEKADEWPECRQIEPREAE